MGSHYRDVVAGREDSLLLLTLPGKRITVSSQAEAIERQLMAEKLEYTKPVLTVWGKIEDLTFTGLTQPGDDGKTGSVLSPGE